MTTAVNTIYMAVNWQQSYRSIKSLEKKEGQNASVFPNIWVFC